MSEDEGKELTQLAMLLISGWEVRQVSIYDDEGVEAWEWVHPTDTRDFNEVGLWTEFPPVPEILMGEHWGL